MNSFEQTKQIEARSRMILQPFLREGAQDGALVFVDKGPLVKLLQETIGDAVMTDQKGNFRSVELKAEEANRHGNLFLETWSNRNLSDRNSHAYRGSNPGWMFKLRCDTLLYHFVDDDELYVMDFFKLKKWAFEQGNIYKFPERPQSRHAQLNDTWGRCVPIRVIEGGIGLKKFKPLASVHERAA